MAFNTERFRSNLVNFAQPNHFEMAFIGPIPKAPFNEAEIKLFDTTFRFRAFSSQLPGRTLDTLERRYSGPSRMVPTGYAYQPMQISILETENHDVRGFFDKWMNLVASNDSWYCKYYDDIIVQQLRLELFTRHCWLDSAGGSTPVKVYTLHEVYPIAVTATQLDWGSNNTITVINVELQYYIWTASEPSVPTDDVGSKGTEQIPGNTTRGPYKESLRGRNGPYTSGYRTEDKDPYLKYTPLA